jgi:hypothetical protein
MRCSRRLIQPLLQLEQTSRAFIVNTDPCRSFTTVGNSLKASAALRSKPALCT